MDLRQADDTLQTIFAACKQPPNTIPFDKLVLRQKLNTRVYDRLLFFTGLLLLCTILAPLAVKPAARLFGAGFSAPAFVSDRLVDDILYLSFTGDGILYEQAYMKTADGVIQMPVSYDKEAGTICFKYRNTEADIYIPIENAPEIHLFFSPH